MVPDLSTQLEAALKNWVQTYSFHRKANNSHASEKAVLKELYELCDAAAFEYVRRIRYSFADQLDELTQTPIGQAEDPHWTRGMEEAAKALRQQPQPLKKHHP